MKSTKKVAYFVLFTSLTLGSVTPLHAQRRTTFPMPSYTPPPAPRPAPRPVEQERPEPRTYQPENRVPEQRPENNQPAYNRQFRQEEVQRQVTTQPVNVGNSHIATGTALESHSGFTAVRPAVITPGIANAMRYNQIRPDGSYRWRLFPAYTEAMFGQSHTFAITGGFVVVGGEGYFWLPGLPGNGPVWFGVLGPIPDNWVLVSDPLYVDQGDDGNYYLYDALYPGLAIPISAGNNAGDDQVPDGE
jgi:hypothetical protein